MSNVNEEVKELEETSEKDFLSMSDEELMNEAPPEMDLEDETDEEVNNDTDEEAEESVEDRPEESTEEASEEDSEEEEAGSEKEEVEADKEKVAAKDIHKDAPETKEAEDESPKQKIDYKAEYEKIMAPFKANGKTMSLNKAEDVIQLMSMGANYNQKMRAMKPHLKVIKMLDNEGLLDESKLSYLIDLDKKNPEAITKLLKDSGIDPLNVDVEADSNYKTNRAYNVSDKDVELDEVLAEIQGTSTYQETIDVISTKWDEPSKRVIIDDPNIIRDINEHIASGVFAEISTVVDRERVLGRLNGLSDLAAYNQVGQQMQEQGMFKAQQRVTAPLADTSANSKQSDPKLNKRKLAAGGTKQAPGGNKKSDFDPLSMTDADFEKLSVDDLF
jgi:hypothetical protein